MGDTVKMFDYSSYHADSIRTRVRLDPGFPSHYGVTQAHIEAVLAGTEAPNAALIAALYPEDPDDDSRL